MDTLKEVYIKNRNYFQNNIEIKIKVDENGEYRFHTSGLFELPFTELAVHIKLLYLFWVWRVLPMKVHPSGYVDKKPKNGKKYEINLIYDQSGLFIENYSGFTKFIGTDEELLSSTLHKAYLQFWNYVTNLCNGCDDIKNLIIYIQTYFNTVKNYTIEDHIETYIRSVRVGTKGIFNDGNNENLK